MEEIEYYISELKKYIDQNKKEVIANKTVEDSFQDFLSSITDSYLQAFEERDLVKMKQLLEDQHDLRNKITKLLKKSENQTIITLTKIVDQYNIFNKIHQSLVENESTRVAVKYIEHKYKDTRSIMMFLYTHSHVKCECLMKELNISQNSVVEVLDALEDVGLVERFQLDNFCFYDLCSKGRKYLQMEINNNNENNKLQKKQQRK